MKFYTLIFYFLSLISWSQDVRELVLFRGIENHLYLKELTENELLIVNDSSILVQQKNNSIYLSVPGLFPLNTVQLQVINKQTKTIKTELEVPVVFVPDPKIYFYSTNCYGAKGITFIKSTSKINDTIELNFEVISYSISLKDSYCNGYGRELIAHCIGLLKQANVDDVFTITAKVKGPDGIFREVKGQFTL